MRQPIAAFGLTLFLVAPAAYAQNGPRAFGGAPKSSVFGTTGQGTNAPSASPTGNTATAEKSDPKVFPAESVLPGPIPPDQIKPATIALPNEAIEPYLLTKDNGPFMVIARTFRGPDAERFALALALELRRDYGLPAYILRTKDFPNRSMIRNVPPTASEIVRKAQLTEPEKVRSYDEAAVLVGNEKTLDDSEALLHKVKKIKPKCLNQMPSIFAWRTGLSTALRTTNPYVPAQNLFPGRRKDNLIAQMNSGPRSINNCPARYSLQVAEFAGRTVYNPTEHDTNWFENTWLRKSPLVTAADDAERLADALAKDPEVQKTGYQSYVYHDRTSSKVMIGAFNDPHDPSALKLRESLIRMAVDLSHVKDSTGRKRAGVLIAPANQLTDLQDPNQPIGMR
jgi:hypothetical protein